ncbi:tetratricopeptide (TPR) repeat protein [Pullulanibacillus pueri]|uniref:Transcriptional regulator n=1 Tax=Pullulanibacillus pueri TaxID=1437324 RepID=A0A8J2ZZZ3_9BACL|nr:helix-turn-helix transcriptional regulator [Pullulanibacillus pueri]MBM7683810.1 tetratricopeptide (TPR) repeat protein [Pullulanibacillus pueri]GGH87664.1 transcriptional regulator [Pullulanibacillus pueri]
MIGKRIRYYRKLSGHTLESLSEGICSVSYLSKIEHGDKSSEEIISFLCERLGINYSDVDNSEETERINILLNQWYKAILDYEDKSSLIKKRDTIKKALETSQIEEPLIYLKFDLFNLRFQFFLNSMEDAENTLKYISKFKDIFNSELQYYYLQFSGIYYNFINDFTKANDCFKEAEDILTRLSYSEAEEAQLYYQMANLYVRFSQVRESIKYAEMALEKFNKDYNLTRIADCQVLLGIGNRLSKNLNKAEHHYEQALKFVKILDDPQRLGIIHHNLGHVKSQRGSSKEAIEHYRQGLTFAKGDSKAMTHYLLALEYYKLNQIRDCLKQIEEGLPLSQKSIDKEYYYSLLVLKHKALGQKDRSYELLIKNEVIPYFSKIQKWDQLTAFAEELAEHFYETKAYKRSSEMYKIANEAIKKLR